MKINPRGHTVCLLVKHQLQSVSMQEPVCAWLSESVSGASVTV